MQLDLKDLEIQTLRTHLTNYMILADLIVEAHKTNDNAALSAALTELLRYHAANSQLICGSREVY